jgi:hypothetical protein
MALEALKARHSVNLRATSGALTAADRPLPLFGLGGFRRAIVRIMLEAVLVTPQADDRVRFHFETAYGADIFAASGELLTADIDDTQTNVGVDDAGTFVVGDVVQVGIERMLVTATDLGAPGVITVDRGIEGDARAAHLNNAVVNLQNVDWVEVAQITYDDTDDGTAPEALVVLGSTDMSPVILDDIDAALADDTILPAPLGDRLRIRTSVAGATAPTYNYSARASLQN